MSTTKKVIDPFKIVDAGDMSGNITSVSTNVRSMDMLTFYVEWTGSSPIGYLSFQYVQKEFSNPDLEEWKTIYLGPSVGNLIPISEDSGSHTVVFTMVPFVKIRALYTASSGTGDLTVTITGKEG